MSTKTKFTKGIWSLRHDLIGVVDHSDTQSYGMMLNICSMDSWDFKEEWESNAQLIAAAPKITPTQLIIAEKEKELSSLKYQDAVERGVNIVLGEVDASN